MTLTPFTLVEMRGMSIVTATWLMFMVAGASMLIYWMLREFGTTNKKCEKHDVEIDNMNRVMSGITVDVAVTRAAVERIDKNINNKYKDD